MLTGILRARDTGQGCVVDAAIVDGAADMAENAGGEGHGKGPMKKIQDAMSLGFNDANNDGQVSKQEFMDATAAMLEMADRNGDGVISGDDFGKR
jgi:crotonobetainyl-CoA:carnitine CoA-transferase CaiB-like acyl-CoA transferase